MTNLTRNEQKTTLLRCLFGHVDLDGTKQRTVEFLFDRTIFNRIMLLMIVDLALRWRYCTSKMHRLRT